MIHLTQEDNYSIKNNVNIFRNFVERPVWQIVSKKNSPRLFLSFNLSSESRRAQLVMLLALKNDAHRIIWGKNAVVLPHKTVTTVKQGGQICVVESWGDYRKGKFCSDKPNWPPPIIGPRPKQILLLLWRAQTLDSLTVMISGTNFQIIPCNLNVPQGQEDVANGRTTPDKL
jgi:hypothetical protein